MEVFVIFGIIIFSIILIRKGIKKLITQKNTLKIVDQPQKNAYELYSNWCEKHNEIPINENEFNKLANDKGKINLSDVMDNHRTVKFKQETNHYIKNEPTYEEKLKEEKAKQKEKNQQFVNSAIIGYMTNSTTKGALFGGSVLGGMFGNHLKNKKKK